MVKAFASNPDVVFGDINLSKQQVRGNHNPGQGGWPTIKYFNKDTGINGAPYVKKENNAMCDELGNEDNMKAYVELAADLALDCDIHDPSNCNEKEKKFVEKWIAKISESTVHQDSNKEIRRLKGLKVSKGVNADTLSWISKRIGILKQFAPKIEDANSEL